MKEQPFQTFLELIKLDDSIRLIRDKINLLETEYVGIENQQTIVETQLKQTQDAVHNAQKRVDELELEVKVLDDQEKEKKKKIDTITNYKEIQSLQNEINKLQQAQHEKEQEVMTAWNALESAQIQLKNKKQDISTNLKDLEDQKKSVKDTIEQLRANLKTYTDERPDKLQAVPEDWIEKYQSMASRVSDPVVEMIGSSCGACYYLITEQDLLRVGRRAIIQCKGCFRLLYDPNVMQES